MASPVNDVYSGVSGAVIRAGSAAVPLWMAGKPLFEWFPIPNTSGAGGATVDAYSGGCIRDDTSEFFIGCAGGHAQGLDNRMVSLDMRQDIPVWVTRRAASASTAGDTPIYPDGRPASNHTYNILQWCPQRQRVVLAGMGYGYPSGNSYPNVFMFNPDPAVNDWDASSTYTSLAAGHYGFARGANGDIWTSKGRWNQATATHEVFDSWGFIVHFPGAYDSLRNQVLSVQFGNGQGFNPEFGLVAYMVNSSGVQSAVTLTGSALSALTSDAPSYSALQYDPVLDLFLFYPGAKYSGGNSIPSTTPKTVYTIHPTTFAVEILAQGAGSATPNPTPATGSGICGRFLYVPGLKGFVLLPQQSSNLYFMRTAA